MSDVPETQRHRPAHLDAAGGMSLEDRATRDFFAGDSGSVTPTCFAAIPTSAKVAAYNLLNAGTRVTERKLFALVDAASCVLDHGQRYGGQETTRLALEAVAPQAIALAALRALEGQPRPGHRTGDAG